MAMDVGAGQSRPLDGCRVIELGSTVAGPFCGRLLADFGADVVKVEQRQGDVVRTMGKRAGDRSLYAASILRNKRNLAVDLNRPEGQVLARRLCATADIVVENFKPGTLERWGLSYETLRSENPGLVLVRISGFGQDGPYSGRPGYGIVCEAVGGLREITGDPDRPPSRVAVSLTDYITGLYAAFGAVLALLARKSSGMGQVVDAALYESAFSFMEPHVPAFQQLGEIARRAGARLPDNAPNSLYPTADGHFIQITAVSDAIFARLMEVIHQPRLVQDPRFSTADARSDNVVALDIIIGAWTGTYELEFVEAKLHDASIPAARIYTMQDIFADPHFAAREAIVTATDPVLGPVAMTNVTPRLSSTPGKVNWPGRQTGEDTYSVLGDDLGMTRREVADLIEAGVLFAMDTDRADGQEPSGQQGEVN